MTGSRATRTKFIDLLVRFQRDQSGNYAIITALMLPVLVGFAGLAAETGLWFYTHQAILSAADSAAVSAATAGGNFPAEASGVAASYGFVNGVNGVTVTVNQPPLSGTHKTTPGAVEVIVQQQQSRLFSALFSSTPLSVSARAVAVGGEIGCVLALNGTADGAVSNSWMGAVNLGACSLYDNSSSSRALRNNSGTYSAALVGVVGGIEGTSGITATNGVKTGIAPVADPYASVSPPSFSGCTQTNYSTSGTATLSPGVYCGGINLNNGAKVTLNPGIYYLDQGALQLSNPSTLTGAGVTLVFTASSGNWASASVPSGATVNLTAPTTGPTAGIVLFGDRNMSLGTQFSLQGGATQSFGGAIYLPKAQVQFTGTTGAGGCTQLIADKIEFDNASHLEINCTGYGTRPFGPSTTAALVE